MSGLWLIPLAMLELWSTVRADQCVDYQGRSVNHGSNFIPNKLRPCIECLCMAGVGVRCGPPLCLHRVDCALDLWNSTVCCSKECLDRSPASRFTEAGRNRDFQVPFWITRANSEPVYGLDDSIYKAQRTNDDTQLNAFDDNSTSSPSRTQNLPSPYYPILIGLISCAPVALCIICVNAVRKYVSLRNQFPSGSFFPRRRRTTQVHGATNEITVSPVAVFSEPPPAYKDLASSKFRLSEDLPRYEDVIKHERSDHSKVFATTSSAQFIPPERVNFAFSVEDETVLTTTSNQPSVLPSSSSHNPAPLTAAPPSRPPPTVKQDVGGGVDNPAHES